MITLELDQDNDLQLNATGTFTMLGGVQAVAQTTRNYAATRRAEMIHEMDLGIPFGLTAFDRAPNLAQFDAALRRRLLEAPEVVRVVSVDVRVSGDILKYSAIIDTTDGAIQIDG